MLGIHIWCTPLSLHVTCVQCFVKTCPRNSVNLTGFEAFDFFIGVLQYFYYQYIRFLKKSNLKKCSLTFFFLKLYVLLLNCKVVNILMGSFTVFNSINMCIGTHFLFLPFIGWLGASLRIVQHRLLINWQRYLSKCFFMKECRGDRSMEISQRKQQSERERERFSTPPNPYLHRCIFHRRILHRCIFYMCILHRCLLHIH